MSLSLAPCGLVINPQSDKAFFIFPLLPYFSSSPLPSLVVLLQRASLEVNPCVLLVKFYGRRHLSELYDRLLGLFSEGKKSSAMFVFMDMIDRSGFCFSKVLLHVFLNDQ